MFARKEISHRIGGPNRSENARHVLVRVYRERCVHICMRFERIILLCRCINVDFEPQRLLFFHHFTMCSLVETSRMHVKDLTAICD